MDVAVADDDRAHRRPVVLQPAQHAIEAGHDVVRACLAHLLEPGLDTERADVDLGGDQRIDHRLRIERMQPQRGAAHLVGKSPQRRR